MSIKGPEKDLPPEISAEKSNLEQPQRIEEKLIKPEERIEAGLVRLAGMIDEVEDGEWILEEPEVKKAETLRERLAQAGRNALEIAKGWPSDELRLQLEADHGKDSTRTERDYIEDFKRSHPEFSFDLRPEKEHHEAQVARILFELHKNEDYYRRHPKTGWEVRSTVMKEPVVDNSGALHTLRKIGERFVVFTRIRAREMSEAEPVQDMILGELQRKATRSGAARLFLTLGTEFEGDALEPVRGLPLPKSPRFKTEEEAQEFLREQEALIAGISAIIFPGRIQTIRSDKRKLLKNNLDKNNN